MRLACSIVKINLRPATRRDIQFIEEMLVEAANWDPRRPKLAREDVLSRRELARYVESWGRVGDTAVVAEVPEGRIGTAWFRFFSRDDPGYGFIDVSIPELALGVVEGFRRRGVGDRLLAALEDEARRRGLTALSLSVEKENHAVRLYERRGFRVVSEMGGSYIMRLSLSSQDPGPAS